MIRPAPPINLVEHASGLSRYLRGLINSGAWRGELAEVQTPFSEGQIRAAARANGEDEAELSRKLRKLRQAVMAHIIVRDLGGLAELQEVMDTVTTLAEETLRAALHFYQGSLRDTYGDPRNGAGDVQLLHIVAMGKLGGGELNVSSDIDLVFVYPEAGKTDGKRKIDNHDYFSRLARKIIGLISSYTEVGFVFRVDTRLRPYGESGPQVVSFDMLEEYFYTQGREWERYAWVKARPLTGDRGEELMAIASPFVYRRHLDFSALGSLRDLHSKIQQEGHRRESGDDIKLGPGGIREIEFVVQVFQLIRGGNEYALRVRSTLRALEQLELRGLLGKQAGGELRDAYFFLRNLEHRLQYLDDKQTQRLPGSAEDRRLIITAMGFANQEDFFAELALHRGNVQKQFDAIFAESQQTPSTPCADIWSGTISDSDGVSQLKSLGFSDPESTLQRLARYREGSRFARMSASGQSRLERLMPSLIQSAADESKPDVTLDRVLAIIESIGRRESYLALLLEYPRALTAVARLASASPWAAEYLARQPVLLDELIAPQRTDLVDWKQLQTELHEQLEDASDSPEQQMDLLRHFKHAQTFRLLAVDLAGGINLETLSDHLSELAAVLLGETLQFVWRGLRQRHRDNPRFAIVGYGKLGGKELGYASDLDIIFLYDDDVENASEIYGRLAQRINTWLASTTAAGVLYETDLRLRPNGAAGLMVSSIEAFRDYQFNQAWIWEHQALTRARAVCGDAVISSAFEQIRIDVLSQNRELDGLRTAVIDMRQKMRDGHPNTSDLFDLKHDAGGIVDVEFIVQYLVLGYAATYPRLTSNIGNLALLSLAAELDLIPRDIAADVVSAYRFFRARQHALRLQGERYARLDLTEVSKQVDSVTKLWSWVFDERNA
ncbi:MAG: bifunctional [glutamate--ammonia ligase]-adenylyl-L-tyrosine phosphorylase/[glutamate--ammonia-ligase] adenylyltransferase [Betaproteobacteria bacterium]|nr:MAG: bifunctional [glutamate--ammonia ligase]-adenylyl-L-tyrosine phosphorylase/[glutamate--ammonia-ligase] adenylyltransferase [Betaproteobacteria bacterium]